ncbi:MAG: NUDIX domain-containing protein [Candidatus Aminicenantes bacterium]|nr:NUDIX domain-containing protein [Candidatus Aminicenantes bacterium]
MKKVAAAVIEKDGYILLARRKKEKKWGGFLEFPGGKILPDENPAKGLSRELQEEFGVEVKIVEFLGVFKNETVQPEIELWVFRAKMVRSPAYLIDHDEVIWVQPQAIPLAELLPLDREIVPLLLKAK